ncbi:hypothetical protein M422DRAFT_252749 [Sphaerobolus stellatus SS14]|uniref:Uncharacterized protein n=1 Tax=Sphaerobolus stellatus (strain SS14) TaxID=990650 RepID=A0A0C9UA43_SPHS4|nr:hypothetical protein M422DRAFT_273101 [Sphaerobolus stellatus SS14]KIJ43838.1 hypothetical protein M422DRAFT_252749 [Sphaerobolus stellatus SS14]
MLKKVIQVRRKDTASRDTAKEDMANKAMVKEATTKEGTKKVIGMREDIATSVKAVNHVLLKEVFTLFLCAASLGVIVSLTAASVLTWATVELGKLSQTSWPIGTVFVTSGNLSLWPRTSIMLVD